ALTRLHVGHLPAEHVQAALLVVMHVPTTNGDDRKRTVRGRPRPCPKCPPRSLPLRPARAARLPHGLAAARSRSSAPASWPPSPTRVRVPELVPRPQGRVQLQIL